MKKRVLSLFLAFVMTLSLAAPAFAAEEPFLAEESAAQEDMAPAPAEPEDPVPMEAEAAEPAPPVEAEPDYEPEPAVAEPAPAVMDEPMPAALEDTPATIATTDNWDGEGDFETDVWQSNTSGTITMSAGATVAKTLEVGLSKDVTVEGNNVYITANDTVFNVNGGSLTLSGTLDVYSVSSTAISVTNGSLTLSENVEVYTVGGNDRYAINVSGGTLNIKDNAKVKHEGGAAISVNGGTAKVEGGDVGKITVNSGTAEVKGGKVNNLTVKTGGAATVESGATIEKLDLENGKVTYSGGDINTFNVEGDHQGDTDSATVMVNEKATLPNLTVKSVGTVTINGSGTITTLKINGGTGAVKLDGSVTIGTLTVGSAAAVQKVTIGENVTLNSITITDGTLGDLNWTGKGKGSEGTKTLFSGEEPATLTSDTAFNITVQAKPEPKVTNPEINSDLLYTGEAQSLLRSGATVTSSPALKVIYRLGDDRFVENDKGTFSEIKGTDVGSYTVYYKVIGDYTYKDKIGGPLTVEIGQAKTTTTLSSSAESAAYGGDAVTLTATVTAEDVTGYNKNGTVKFFLGEEELSGKDVTTAFNGTNKLTAQLTLSNDIFQKVLSKDSTEGSFKATFEGNTELATSTSSEKEITINPKELTVENLTFESVTKEYDGNGTLKNCSVKFKEGALEKDDTDRVTVTVTEAEMDGSDFSAIEHKNAMVKAALKLEGDSSKFYKLTGEVGGKYTFNDVTVTITKAPSTLSGTVKAAEGLVFNGEPRDLITLEGAMPTGGTLKYALAEKGAGDQPADEKFTYDGGNKPMGTNAGDYTVWYKVKGDENHNDTTPQKVTATIAKAKTTVELTLTSPGAVTYGDNVTLTATVTADVTGDYTPNGKVTLTQGGKAVGEAKVPTGTTGSWTAEFTLTNDKLKEAIKNGTEGQFKAEFADDANLEGSSGTLQLTVSPKPIQASQLTFAATDSKKVFNDNTDLDTQYYTVTIDKVYVMDDDVTIVSTGATLPDKNVGEHTSVTVNGLELGGTDAACYTLAGLSEDGNKSYTFTEGVSVTVDPFGMTFAPDQWTWPYGDPGTVNPQQTATESPQIATDNIKVTYKYKPGSGEAVDLGGNVPAGPGVYTVCASVTDKNFKLASGAASDKVGTLTITHVHVWSDEWVTSERGSAYHWHPCTGVGECTIEDPENPGLVTESTTNETNGYTTHANWVGAGEGHGGWVTDEDDLCSHRTCADCGYVEHGTHEADPVVWQYDEYDGPEGKHYKVCHKCGLEFDHEAHEFEPTGVTGSNYVEYKCKVCGYTFHEPFGVYPVEGKVTQDGKGVNGATVTLEPLAGGELVAPYKTGPDGEYDFAEVKPGVYTLTVTFNGVTVTRVVEVIDEEVTANVEMPREYVSVKVVEYDVEDSDTPKVTVSGLEQVAANYTGTASDPVTIEMTVTAQEEGEVENDALTAIKEKAGSQSNNLSYLDVTIMKTVGDGEPETIGETLGSTITLVVSYSFDRKNNVTVYRYHNGEAMPLNKLNAKGGADGSFYLDTAHGLIYIYAKQFSVYAIGYTTPTYYPPLTIADKTVLNAAIAAAEALNPEDYTAESWSALETALAAAKDEADFTWAAQEDVDAAAEALQKAIDALVKLVPAVDKSALEASIAEAEALNPEDYTEETWAGVAEALAAAKDVAADEDATQDEVDAAQKTLDAAVGALAPAEAPEVDKSDLEAAIAEAEALDPEDYTEESWAAVADALAAAKDVAADADATQEDVDAAQKALDAAVGALVPAEKSEVDKSMLEQLIATAELVNEADCTPESWAFMAEALEVAKAIYADPDAPQEDVDAAVLVLFGAIMALELAESEPPAPPSSGTGWMENESGIYFYKDGQLKKSYWVGKVDGASKWDGNWYYVDANGKLLTGMQYLTDLHGGYGWYFLQPTNANGEIGKMLTGWQWVGGEYGTGWFSSKTGESGKCTYTTELGDWNGSAWVK